MNKYIIRDKQGNRIIHRHAYISEIQNTAVRRFFLLIAFPFLLMFNTFIAGMVVIALFRYLYIEQNRTLIDSTIFRWNTPLRR